MIHDGVDLEVRRGEILGLIGGSGSGKSVLLHTILGLNRPAAGRIELLGRDLAEAGHSGIAQRIGMLFQNGALFSSLTVQENVETPFLEHLELPYPFVRDLAALKIRLAGLNDDAGPKRPSALSGGMRRRAGLARAIALDPEILFLDEPTAGLDPISAAAFDELILKLHEALGLTVLMITHDLDALYAVTDRVAVLADQKVVAVAPVAELERSEHPWIKEYLGGPRGRAARKGVH
ncbi:ABC transporter ATP-binding protein [Sphingobium sp. DC-2]|uniref:ABC transporter ATP-binding protein n=1 Tax=Sphingobium sp. DC-2 TaxID=1303256 RepID=UPI001ED9B372|nr:ATP-binding cassette domain-containing protein [Sphingobium sp. DC-2]